MKKYLTLILTLLIVGKCYSQDQDSTIEYANAVVKSFTWDIRESDKGTMMFLDVPYLRENHDSLEYLTLTVAKDKAKKRPEFISIIIPNNIVKANGIFIKFAKSKKGGMKLEKGDIRVEFESCNSEDCTARIIDGYATNEETNKKEDLFQKFLDFDHVLFLFVYPDGSHKSVAVPLFSFQKQYKAL